jgi:predicted RNA-binding protein with RPS1 domain
MAEHSPENMTQELDGQMVSDHLPTEPVHSEATEPVASAPAIVGTAPVVDGTPASESAAVAESTPAVEAAITDSVSTEVAPRKVTLNPTYIPTNVAPVAMYPSEAVAAPVALSASTEGAAETPAPAPVSIPQVVSSGPVELPPRHTALDPNLEAELEAAMSGGPTAVASADGVATPPPSVTVTVQSEEELQAGAKLKAKVQSVSEENVFVDLGFRSPGMISSREFPQGKLPNVGEEFLVVVDKYDAAQGLVLVHLPKSTRKVRGNWDELAVGQIVECLVTKTNKGGLDVAVGQMRAFLPASQVDVGQIGSMEEYVGKKFPVQIVEVNPAKRNIVVSRRSLLIAQRKEAAVQFWQQVEVGQQFAGTVKTLKDYGAFVDLGGADGFLHIGEMSWTRVKHPSEVLAEGQQIDVIVLQLDREKQKIGLGMRQLTQNPWAAIETKYSAGQNVEATVIRVTEFGAFMQLEVGIEGLVHISELDYRRVKRVDDVLKVGQRATVQILEVDPERQRISLSLKALKPKPEVEAPKKDEDLSPSGGQAYERKRREPLRGGTGGKTPGGLFGNPTDFGNKG